MSRRRRRRLSCLGQAPPSSSRGHARIEGKIRGDCLLVEIRLRGGLVRVQDAVHESDVRGRDDLRAAGGGLGRL